VMSFLTGALSFVVPLMTWSLFAGDPSACGPLTNGDKARLVRYVTRKYEIPADVGIGISQVSLISDTCYRKVLCRTRASW